MNDFGKIFEKSRELAELLLETDEGKALNDARYIFEGDNTAQKLMSDYGLYRQNVQNRMANGDLTEEELERENDILAQKIKELQENEIIKQYFIAEQNFNNIINHVMNVFNATIAGEADFAGGGCSGSCSGCPGCH